MIRTTLNRTAALAAAAATLLSLAACGGSDDPPATQVTTSFGTVEGVDRSATSGTHAWLGVPYAKPPVGALRWMPPVDPAVWVTVGSNDRGNEYEPNTRVPPTCGSPASESSPRCPPARSEEPDDPGEPESEPEAQAVSASAPATPTAATRATVVKVRDLMEETFRIS